MSAHALASTSNTATVTAGHPRRPGGSPLHSHSTPSQSGPPPPSQPQPLYITIGPPCSGKTTWLRSVEGRGNAGTDEANIDHSGRAGATVRVQDVALDDQPGIYVPVALRDALPLLSGAGAATASLPEYSNNETLRSVILGRSVAERLRSDDQRELCLVLRRLALRMSSTDFAEQMLGGTAPPQESTGAERGHSSDGLDRELVNLMIDAVEEALSRQVELHEEGGDVITTSAGGEDENLPPWMPPTVDLFVQDRIFRSESAKDLSGIDSAHLQLRRACMSPGVVAWGNTNTRPREYKEALQLASETGRTVQFVTYYDDSDLGIDEIRAGSGIELEDDTVALTGSVKELLGRNVERLLRTGRFVPSIVIHTMYKRSQNLVNMVLDQWRAQLARDLESSRMECAINSAQPTARLERRRLTKFEFDRILVRLANYEMNQDRTVVPMPPHRQRRVPNDRQAPPRRSAGYSFDSQGSENGNTTIRRPWDKMPRRTRPQREGPLPGVVNRDGHSPASRPPQKVRKSSWNNTGDAGMPPLGREGRR